MTLEQEAQRTVRILAVEDDTSISRLIGLAMPELEMPYTFVAVSSGEEGLELWKQEPFDLLLTDYNLPGMRGTELITALRARGVYSPIILFTAYDTPSLTREVRRLNVSAYIAKPFLIEDMIDTMRRLLHSSVGLVQEVNR